MSFAGRAESTSGCATKPKGREIGLPSCVTQIQSSLLTGSYVMATAEQWEPYESRGSRTVLGEPGGESPPGHSTFATEVIQPRMSGFARSGHELNCEKVVNGHQRTHATQQKGPYGSPEILVVPL